HLAHLCLERAACQFHLVDLVVGKGLSAGAEFDCHLLPPNLPGRFSPVYPISPAAAGYSNKPSAQRALGVRFTAATRSGGPASCSAVRRASERACPRAARAGPLPLASPGAHRKRRLPAAPTPPPRLVSKQKQRAGTHSMAPAPRSLKLLAQTQRSDQGAVALHILLLQVSQQDRKSTRLNSSHVSISYA